MKSKGNPLRISPFLLRYIVSHLLLVLLPLLLILQFVFGGYFDVLETELIERNSTMLEQTSKLTDMKMHEIDQIAINMSGNSNLLPSSVTRNNYRASKACQEVKRYMVGNDLIFESMYYLRGKDYLYASLGTYPVDRAAELYFQYESLPSSLFYDLIENSTFPILLPMQTVTIKGVPQNIITYIIPISTGGTPYATAIFLLDENEITTIANSVFGTSNGYTAIFNSQGRLLAPLNSPTSLDFDALFRKAMGSDEQNHIIFEEEKYLTTKVKAGYKDWIYISFVPSKEIMMPANQMRSVVTTLIVVIFILGFLIAGISININYAPIKKVFQKAQKKLLGTGPPIRNEMLAIDRALDELSTDNLYLREYIDENKGMIAQKLLQDLFRGDVPDPETLQAREEETGLTLQGYQYATIVLLFSQQKGKTLDCYIEDFSLLEKPLEKLGMHLHPLNVVSEANFPILVTLEEHTLLQPAVLLLHEILQQLSLEVTMGVSPVYTEAEDIALSYSQATQALAYRFVKGNGSIIFYDTLYKSWDKDSWYPKEKMEELLKHVNGGNLLGVKESVATVVQHVKEEEMELFMARMLCFDVINTVIKFIAELDLHMEDLDQFMSQAAGFSTAETVDELGNSLDKLCTEVSLQIQENRDREEEILLEYVEKYYRQNDFSVRQMAEDMELSYSYMSKYFHAKTGYTVLDYVTNLRMDYIKRQLVITNDTIKNIATNAGYIDVPNFTRKFKQLEGATPGQYREQYQGAEESPF